MRTNCLSAALTAAFLLAGCAAENRASNGEPQSKAANEHIKTGNGAEAPSNAGAGVKVEPTAMATGLTIGRALSQDEKSLLASIDSRYFGTLTHYLPGEAVDLGRLGFPGPSNWIAAASSTDEELLQNARKGGHLDKALYIDRVASLVPENNWKGVSNTAEDAALATKIMDARSLALQNIGTTKSPFSVYQAAALFNTTEVGGNPAMVAASFQLAAELGDTRATRMLQTYMSANRNIDAKGVLAAYTFLKSDLRDRRGL